jgi:acetoin utilization deacetylase AcuC-like enzyme
MQTTLDAAADLCNGRVVVMHEGGYSEAYVPFCGHALIEAMAGHRTPVVDPNLEAALQQQPGAPFQALQRSLLAELAAEL